jgi:hypothetical protein
MDDAELYLRVGARGSWVDFSGCVFPISGFRESTAAKDDSSRIGLVKTKRKHSLYYSFAVR